MSYALTILPLLKHQTLMAWHPEKGPQNRWQLDTQNDIPRILRVSLKEIESPSQSCRMKIESHRRFRFHVADKNCSDFFRATQLGSLNEDFFSVVFPLVLVPPNQSNKKYQVIQAVTFLFVSWRSLNLWKGHSIIPKRSPAELLGIDWLQLLYFWTTPHPVTVTFSAFLLSAARPLHCSMSTNVKKNTTIWLLKINAKIRPGLIGNFEGSRNVISVSGFPPEEIKELWRSHNNVKAYTQKCSWIPRIPVTNEGLGWDSLLKMVHNPGGHWNPGWGVVPSYTCFYTLGSLLDWTKTPLWLCE